MIRVRDIMTREVVSLSTEASVDNAVWSMSANGITAAPVRDDKGKVVGVLSKSDLVDPVHHGPVRGDMLVGETMTPTVWCVHPDSPASEAISLMVEKKIHRVLVMVSPDNVEGILSSMDVMRAVIRGMDLRPLARAALRGEENLDTRAASVASISSISSI